MVLITESDIYCANSGDSRAVMCLNGQVVDLSYDHKPTNPYEKERILKEGGNVVDGRVNGELSLSRAIGDF